MRGANSNQAQLDEIVLGEDVLTAALKEPRKTELDDEGIDKTFLANFDTLFGQTRETSMRPARSSRS